MGSSINYRKLIADAFFTLLPLCISAAPILSYICF